MDNKINAGILYGGKSVEHQVSINSAKNIYQFINRELYEPFLIGIDKKGNWFLNEGVSKNVSDGNPLMLTLEGDQPSFYTHDNISIKPDVIFPVLHGTGGEDGSIQGMLQVFNIACVGTGVLGSGISMDKIITKELLTKAGLPVIKYEFYTRDQKNEIDFDHIADKIGLPLMIKPASLGSSVGVSKISNKSQFKEALDNSFKYDNQLICEEFIEGRELECAILGNNPAKASIPGEIVVNKDEYDFYTFDAKYVDPDAVKLVVPAKIENDVIEEVRDLALRSYKVMRCEDYARVDLFMRQDGKIFVNEINTIPGFTNASMFPLMWEHSGIPYQDLITELITLAIERHKKLNQVTTDFISKLD